MAVKRVLRRLQTHVPAVRPLKYRARNFAIRRLGLHLPPEFVALGRLRSVEHVIDIGANWGTSISALKRTVNPRRIVSFEPNPVLAENVRRFNAGDDGVTLHEYALSDEEGTATLYIPRYGGYVFDGLSSLDEAEARDWLNADRLAGFDPERLHVDACEIRMRRLDDFGLEPDMIKVDVQGAEQAVVTGGLKTIETHRPVIVMETPSEALVAQLEELDLLAFAWRDGGFTREWRGSTDVVFLPPGRRAELRL